MLVTIIKELHNINDNYNLFFQTSLVLFLVFSLIIFIIYLINNLKFKLKEEYFFISVIFLYLFLIIFNSNKLFIKDKEDNFKNEAKLLKILSKEKKFFPNMEKQFAKDYNLLFIDYFSDNKYLTSNDILNIKNKILKFNINILKKKCLNNNKILNYKTLKCIKPVIGTNIKL